MQLEKTADVDQLKEQLKANIEERKQKRQMALQAISEGRGRLKLETPITAGDEEITELPYDFMALTGHEFADAMDSDRKAQQVYQITYRQALNLFAWAAAKQSDKLDVHDIVERLGVTDAVEGVQLATLFFNASTRAGQLRISKR